MCRRITLIDQNETKDYTRYYGSNLGNEIYTLQGLESMPKYEKERILKIGNNDAVLLVGAEPFKYLQEYYHFGIRNENYFDCSKLRRLSIEGGAFVKCISGFPEDSVIQDFMSPEFTTHRDFSWFRHKVLHTYQETLKFLEWIKCLPLNEPLGFDYEASGMPLDKWFEISGASLCNNLFGAFISFTDLRRYSIKEEYEHTLEIFREILETRMNNIWVFNQQYEFQVSHRMLKFVDLYNLCDAGIINVLDGNHLKKYSLKWTAQNVIEATVWDTDFDRLGDLLDKMYFDTVGKTKKERKKVLKVTPDNYKNTPEWEMICSLYPNYIQEFETLISEYFGCPFMNIPSDILGYYCNLDAFYTLQIYLARKDTYSEEAFQTFLDNSRLGARLHSSGLYIDEPYRLRYQKECHKMMAWGITYTATARCMIKMKKHSKLMADIKKYNQTCRILLENNNFFNGNSLEITKFILTNNIDSMDAYETGLNEWSLLMTYGENFAEKFIDIVKESMIETKFKGKIDQGISRKKKILGIISEKLSLLLGLDKIKISERHLELEKYLYYERAYLELCNISRNQLNDINNIPDTIRGFGQEFNLLDYSTFISNNYFKCKSPIENDEIVDEMYKLYQKESSFIAALSESIQQLPGDKKEDFFKNLGINNIGDAFNHFMYEWEKYCNIPEDGIYQGVYPIKIFNLALQFWKGGIDVETAKDVHPVKDVWADFIGFTTQTQFFNELNSQYDLYSIPFQEQDLQENFYFMRKFTINYLLYKKYAKVLSTYIDGMFKANNKWVIEGEDHIPIREADPGEPGAVEKCFVHYEVNTKSSKRWSSGFHTIISHSDLKDCIIPPYHYDEYGNRVDEGFVETYFDISSAEVKAAGFASEDPDLIDKFQKGEDIYIYSAKLYLGDDFDKLQKTVKKMWRKRFKTIFLGVLYGLGKKSLAERLNCSEEEAENIIQGLYKSFPKLREYVAIQQQYPLENSGFVNTMLGDKLKVQEYEWLLKATSEREKKNLIARIKRLGVNLPIQGGTSSIMARGFMNNIRVSKQQSWKNPLQPIIVVHDSNTNYVPISKVFEIRKFYDENYTKYCASFGPRIMLLFDLLLGVSYEKACPMKTIDDDTIEYEGNAYSLLGIYDKIMNCPDLKVKCSMERSELIPKFVEDPIDRFIQEKGTCIVKDLSKYTIQFRKVS